MVNLQHLKRPKLSKFGWDSQLGKDPGMLGYDMGVLGCVLRTMEDLNTMEEDLNMMEDNQKLAKIGHFIKMTFDLGTF